MTKGVQRQGGEMDDLSPEQRDVLCHLTEDFLTPKQISIRRETTQRAVYKTMSKLRRKGYLSIGNARGFQKSAPLKTIEPPTDKLQNGIRLHGQEFNCRILWRSPAYDNLRRSKNVIYWQDHTIRLYAKAIEIYSGEHKSFLAEDEQRATALSLKYWGKFFNQLENKLHILIIKGLNTQIRQVNAHYEEINNEFAKDCNEKKVKVSIYTTDDAKLWFKIDNSWHLNGAETLHPATSKQDMGSVKRFFNDVRDNNPPTISELLSIVSGNVTATQGLISSQEMYAANIATHIEAVNQLGKGVNKLTKVVEKLEKSK